MAGANQQIVRPPGQALVSDYWQKRLEVMHYDLLLQHHRSPRLALNIVFFRLRNLMPTWGQPIKNGRGFGNRRGQPELK